MPFQKGHPKPINAYSFKKGQKFSDGHKEKISLANNGRKLSEEHKKKLREVSNSGRFKKGHKLNTGELHPQWKDGISYGENKKGYYRIKSLERVARKNGASGSHTFAEWETLKAQYNWTCPACGRKEPIISLTEDHIIPLIRGGSQNIENIQPLCLNCNSRKNTKIIKYNIYGK